MKRRQVLTTMVGVLVLSIGLAMAHYGNGAQGAPPNPFAEILAKLDQILAALTSASNNHTLRWDTSNPSSTRFTTVFPGAVLDKNTGLVWEQAPDITGGPNADGKREWFEAIKYCLNKEVGGTMGWRLPSVVELTSLKDLTLPAPFVPASVFTNVQTTFYWSATSFADFPITHAWNVLFNNGIVAHYGKILPFNVWCVRGGMDSALY